MTRILTFMLSIMAYTLAGATQAQTAGLTDIQSLKDCRFVPRMLLAPDEFARHEAEAKSISLPHSWEHDTDIGGRGYATYECRMSFGGEPALRQMTVYYLGEAYRLWVNGEEFLHEGFVAVDPENLRPASKRTVTLNLPASSSYTIIMQVVNFSGAGAGVFRAPILGESEDIAWNQIAQILPVIISLTFLLLLVVYNFIVYRSYRLDKAPLYVLISCLGSSARFAAIQPFHVMQYVAPYFPAWLAWKLEFAGLVIASIFCFKAIDSVFRHNFKKLEHLYFFCGLAYLLLIIFGNVSVYRPLLQVWQVLTALVLILTFVIVMRVLKDGKLEGRIFAGGGLIWIAFMILEICDSFCVESTAPFALYGLLIFSYVLSYIVMARNATIHEFLRQQRIMSKHAVDQLAKIVYPHQLDRIQQGMPLEETMPTVLSEAIVISFDVVSSSTIKHPKVLEFLESAIMSCVSVMNENYDPDRVRAAGYRIKEMGDGFLCSVGFPFASLTEGKLADEAVALAFRFIESFQKDVEALQYEYPIYCSLGVAYGNVQGYYPKAEPKEYDIFGHGIVLATRYEQIRKVLFSGLSSHVMILHEKVYYSLRNETRKKFTRVALSETVAIHEDKEAQELFYCKR